MVACPTPDQKVVFCVRWSFSSNSQSIKVPDMLYYMIVSINIAHPYLLGDQGLLYIIEGLRENLSLRSDEENKTRE